ncbi:MAG: hypothetical protein ABI780_11280 [Ardenticatenales bacterium]
MTLPTNGFDLIRRTERALLVCVAGREVWLPASQVRWTAEGLWMPTWLAQAKGVAAQATAPVVPVRDGRDWRMMRRAARVRAAGHADYEPCAARGW